jgi:hypothetical protein
MTGIITKLKKGQRWLRRYQNGTEVVYQVLHIFVDLHGRQKVVIQMVPRAPKLIGTMYFQRGNKQPPRIVSPSYLCCFSPKEATYEPK